MLLSQKNYTKKLCCDQNSKINLIKEEIISTGAIISVSVIIAEASYVKLRKNILIVWMSNKSQTINSTGKVSNDFLMTKNLILQK